MVVSTSPVFYNVINFHDRDLQNQSWSLCSVNWRFMIRKKWHGRDWRLRVWTKMGWKRQNFARSLLVNAAVVTQREVFIRVDFPCSAWVVRKLQGVGRVVTLLLSILYSSISAMSHLFCFTKKCYFRLFYVMVTLELEQIFEIILSLFSSQSEHSEINKFSIITINWTQYSLTWVFLPSVHVVF